jgi:hypothetical protein
VLQFLKTGKFHRKQHVGNILGNDVKVLESTKACKYFGVEESQTQNI